MFVICRAKYCLEKHFSSEDVDAFLTLTGDTNAIHNDHDAAQRAGSLLLSALTQDAETLCTMWSQRMSAVSGHSTWTISQQEALLLGSLKSDVRNARDFPLATK